jgi:hypothetical protein
VKNPVSYPETDFDRFEENAKALLGSIVVLTVVCGLLWLCFSYVDNKLQAYGLSTSMMNSVAVWVGVGIPCALFWPLRYWRGMSGLWLRSALHIALLTLTGPFALLLGFPL